MYCTVSYHNRSEFLDEKLKTHNTITVSFSRPYESTELLIHNRNSVEVAGDKSRQRDANGCCCLSRPGPSSSQSR